MQPPPPAPGSLSARQRVLALLCGGAALLALGALLQVPVEYARRTDPRGSYAAIARAPLYESLWPRAPGDAGGKPGHIEVVRLADGASLGSHPVPMVSLLYDLKWKYPRARLNTVAEWTLETDSPSAR